MHPAGTDFSSVYILMLLVHMYIACYAIDGYFYLQNKLQIIDKRKAYCYAYNRKLAYMVSPIFLNQIRAETAKQENSDAIGSHDTSHFK